MTRVGAGGPFAALLLLAGVCAHQAHAYNPKLWPQEAVQQIAVYQDPFPDTFEATVWGNLKISTAHFIGSKPAFQTVAISLSDWAYNPLPADIFWVKDSKGRILKRPLMVYSPGLFSSLGNLRARNLARFFHQQNFHVLYLPNPFSTDYLRARPKILPGDFVNEGQLFLDFVHRFYEMEHRYISSVHWTGESYGAFLAAVVTHHDADSEQPLLSGPTTLWSPPFDFYQALLNLDQLMDDTLQEYKNRSFAYELGLTLNFLSANSSRDLWDSSKDHSRMMMGYGVVQPNLQTFMEEWLKNRVDAASEELRNRSNLELRLRDYVKNYAFELYKKYSGEMRLLSHWALGKSVRIFYAQNDFLDAGVPQNDMDRLQTQSLTIPTGGHSGFLGYSWFEEFVQALYKNQP